MRTIKIQATPATERVMTEWLAHLVLAIPTGPDGGAILFDGDLSNGIVVAQRHEGRWSVSFRPNPDGSRIRHYANPHVVARVILSNPRQHDEAAALDPLPDERDVTTELLACTGMEPAPGSPVLLHPPRSGTSRGGALPLCPERSPPGHSAHQPLGGQDAQHPRDRGLADVIVLGERRRRGQRLVPAHSPAAMRRRRSAATISDGTPVPRRHILIIPAGAHSARPARCESLESAKSPALVCFKGVYVERTRRPRPVREHQTGPRPHLPEQEAAVPHIQHQHQPRDNARWRVGPPARRHPGRPVEADGLPGGGRLPRLRPADQVRAVLPQRVGAPGALLEPRGKLWHGLNAAAAGRSRSGRRARPIISMRSTRPTQGHGLPGWSLSVAASRTHAAAEAVPGGAKDRRGSTARRPASPARLRPADVSASTAGCGRARRGQPRGGSSCPTRRRGRSLRRSQGRRPGR